MSNNRAMLGSKQRNQHKWALLLATTGLLPVVPTAIGASGVWQNTGADWATSSNWSAAFPNSTSDTATLPTVTTGPRVNPNLGQDISTGALTINNTPSASYNITESGARTLTLGGNLTIAGVGSTIISPLIQIVNGARTFDSGSSTLELAGGLAIATPSPTFALTLTLTNTAAATIISGPVTNQTGIVASGTSSTLTVDGTGSLTISGNIGPQTGVSGSGLGFGLGSNGGYTGTLRLSGSNTFAITTFWRAGTLQLAGDSIMGVGVLGNQSLSLGSTSTGNNKAVSVLTSGAYTINNTITIGAPLSTSITLGGSQTSGTSTYSSAITLGNLAAANNGLKVTSAAGGTVVFSGVISGTTAANDYITKIGDGTVVFSGNNTYQGSTTISAGTLSASVIVVGGGVSSLGNATSAVVLGDGLNKGTLSYTGGTATYTRGFTVNLGGGELDNAGSGLLTVSGNVVNTSGGTFTVGGAANTTISSVIGGGSGGLTKTNGGTVTLSNTSNTYTGATLINNGTLALTAASNNIAFSSTITVTSPGILSVGGVTGGFTLASGQTLSGNGTVTGALTAGAGSKIAPGTGVGTLTAAAVTFASTSKLSIDVNDATNTSSDTADKLVASGAVNLGSGIASLELVFTDLSSKIYGQTFVILQNDSGTATSGYFAGLNPGAGTTATFGSVGSLRYTINYAAQSGVGDGVANDVSLTFSSVPEPTSLTLIFGGLIALTQRRRRNRLSVAQ